jgi:hypothetical protein
VRRGIIEQTWIREYLSDLARKSRLPAPGRVIEDYVRPDRVYIRTVDRFLRVRKSRSLVRLRSCFPPDRLVQIHGGVLLSRYDRRRIAGYDAGKRALALRIRDGKGVERLEHVRVSRKGFRDLEPLGFS